MDSFVSGVRELIINTQIEAEEKQSLLSAISEFGNAITPNPRDDTEANYHIIRGALNGLFFHAAQLYGAASDVDRAARPAFMDHPHSLTGPLVDKPERFGIVIGKYFNTWETVFYELAHESVHFLHPIANISENPVATLEEAVAVRFAEDVYSQYVSSYTGLPPLHSPLGRPLRSVCPYARGYEAVKNASDLSLRTLRKEFGSFSFAFNAEKIFEVCAGEIEESDAIVLANQFDYKFGRYN